MMPEVAMFSVSFHLKQLQCLISFTHRKPFL